MTARRIGTAGRREEVIINLIRIVQAKKRKKAGKKVKRNRFIYLMEMEMNTRKNLKEGMMK
jgi:hypothetical protein